jgi:hypothetical protein
MSLDFSKASALTWKKVWPYLFIAAAIVLVAVAAVHTISNSGAAAVALMDDKERIILGKLETLRKGMTPDEVTAILGQPDDPGPLGLRPKWQVNGNPLNAIVVYFHADGAQRVLWLNVGEFSYDRNL